MNEVAIAKGIIETIKIAEKQGFLDQLLNIFRKKHRIIVLGSTGVGKSNLIKSLTEETPKAIETLNRTQFAKDHKIKISKNPFIFIDTPGEIEHKARREEVIRKAMKQEVSGIINVVAYGYHEWNILDDKIKPLNSDGQVRDSYLDQHRNLEIERLSEWKDLLGHKDVANWLITVVTKADLWWHERSKVLNHYISGSYYNSLGSAKSLNPIVQDYCSVLHKFYGKGKLSGTFDDDDRIDTRSRLLQNIVASIGNTTKK